MSAPKFRCYSIDLDAMTVTFVGHIEGEHALHHPHGWTFAITDGETWMRTDDEPVWRKVKDGKATEINIRTATTATD